MDTIINATRNFRLHGAARSTDLLTTQDECRVLQEHISVNIWKDQRIIRVP